MSEQPAQRHPRVVAKRIGLGLAAVALPVAAAIGVWELKQSEDASNDDLEQSFKYDDAKLRQVDPALIGWQEAGQIQTGMSKATCMKFVGGKFYVGGDQQVRVLDEKGGQLATIAIPGVATAIAAGPNGEFYVALKSEMRVFAPDGKEKATWPNVGAHISSIAVSKNCVYLADSGSRAGHLHVFGFDGQRKGELAKEDKKAGVPGIITPSAHMDVAMAADGNLWVANPGRHQLELYSPAGELLRSFGQSGTNIDQFLGCCNPSDFALLSDGRLVTAEKGVPRIKVYSDDGHFQKVVVPPTAFGSNRAGLDLSTDDAGNVLVLEQGTNVIRKYAEKRG